jgi:hypothetical protein
LLGRDRFSSKERRWWHMPRELVRHLVVELVPAESLAPVLAREGPRRFPLAGSLEEYSDWELVSHTFNVRDDDTAVLAVIFEQRARRVK